MKSTITIIVTLLVCASASAQTENNSRYSNDGTHKGLDLSLSAGYIGGVGSKNKGTGYIPVEASLGKQINQNLYLGLRSGAWIGTADKAKPRIPIMADFKLMFPNSSSKSTIKPIINARLGYLLNTQRSIGGGSQQFDDGMGGTIEVETEAVKVPDMITMELSPGIQIPLSNTTDFIISAGYAHGFNTEGGGSGGYFVLKTGVNFHKNAMRQKKKKPRREKVPTRNHGLQYTFEAEGNYYEGLGVGGNFVITYKLNPHLNFGIGGGYHQFSPFKDDASEDIQVIYNNKESFDGYMGHSNYITVFGRGAYRFTDKRFSPFVSVDGGVRLYQWPSNAPYYDYKSYSDMLEKEKTSLFVSPSIGLSLRTSNNSYIELKGGYNLSTQMKGQKVNDGENLYIATRSKNMSYPYLSLGFTHTLGKRGKRPSY